MADTVQCPVCTLYLHAGMNLSDHLETHPKEQVIRALVQMTISGSDVGNSNNNMLSAVLNNNATKKTSNLELEVKPSAMKDSEPDINYARYCTNKATSNSLSNQSLNNSQNSKTAYNLSKTKNEPPNKIEQEKLSRAQSDVPVNTVVKTETTNTVSVAKINMDNVSQCFSKQSYNQTISVSSSTTNASHLYHRNSVELANATSVHNNFDVIGANNRYEQQRSNINNHNQLSIQPRMPPPPPPPSVSPQIQHSVQHQESACRGILPVSTGGNFHSIQPLQLPTPPPPHHSTSHLGNSSGSLRQAHIYQPGQNQQPPSNSHHTQSLKVIYTPNLPPPPPLQLFTYQPQTHLHQHQKPPPAYGTAISQIRSQNNHSKHQMTGALNTQHQTLQVHSVSQQQQQMTPQTLQQGQTSQNILRIQIPPPPSPLPFQTKSTYSCKINDLPNQNHLTASKQLLEQSKTDLSQHQQHPQQQEQQQPEENLESLHNSSNHIFNSNSNEILNKSSLKLTSSLSIQNANANVPPSYPQVSISPLATSASVASVAVSTLSRHTNSPFAALLAAAAGVPSPSNTSSVLRYAESPVAHYLERENGDFIVQETPKHIVECVETDNGEFSVIERIYQSPPSVLHIHDEDDDDEEDEGDNNKDEIENEKLESTDSISKEHDVIDKEIGKNIDDRDLKQSKISSRDVKTKKFQSDDKNSVDDGIVDFVSISSDSSDEEEFISQKLKDHRNTTEKNKTNRSSYTGNISKSTISTQSSSTSSTLATITDEDNQTPLFPTTNSLITSPLSSSATTNTTTTQHSSSNTTTNTSMSRKKSSKNTITVLSDVQLNLNEYLDLVGNIIASSKVAAPHKTFTSVAPIPLVKIEKEEPIDDYLTINAATLAVTAAPEFTNFETAPPLKANKQETEDITDNSNSSCNPQTTINHKIILSNELEQDENEEKKPQVFVSASENEISIAISNTSPSHMNKNSGQVTSVIRMASTSQHQQQTTSMENSKMSYEAEDLSQSQQQVNSVAISKTLSHTPLARKGPKKLIIKPKSTKTEVLLTTTDNKPNQNQINDDQENPSTSAKIQKNYVKQSITEKDILETTDITIKNEPITYTAYGNMQQQPQSALVPNLRILEHHLSSKEPILEFKEEKPCITETSLSSTSIMKEMKIENNVNDDARVLYDFANSKKSQNEIPSTFPSSTSLFSNKQTSLDMTVLEELKNQRPNKKNHENEPSSSTYSSQSMMDTSLPTEEQNKSSATKVAIAHTQNQAISMYNDFHFNYLYNINNNITPVITEQADIKNNQFSSFYQNSSNSNNNIMLQEDSSSSKHYTDYQQLQSNHSSLQQHHHIPPTSHDQWFNSSNYQTSEHNVSTISSNQNINSGLSVDGDNVQIDGSETSKYLDLDSCKQEQNIDLNTNDRAPPPSSSTSCSFNGTTDNSMAGGCSSAATLNIRTDEKMPAKGEISEQESNCDIDNSWSQPMYGDISARFFKTTFPAIFPPDSGWNHDEYFTVQDLSASTNTSCTNSTNNRIKSFDQLSSNNNSNGVQIFSHNSNDNCNIDVMPSTSAKIRKKRKRSSQDGKSLQVNGKRVQPTSTVTSEEMLSGNQNGLLGMEFNFQNQSQLQLHQQHLQLPSTSTTFVTGPSNVSNALSTGFMMQQQQSETHQTQQKQRTKVYECGHCNAKYSKLKDRNAHMVGVHNYIRQNRRLICPTTGLATPVSNSENQDVILPTTSIALQIDNGVGDFKQGIVKIENEIPHRDMSGIESINADLNAKTEMEDDKQNLALLSINSTAKVETVEYDSKPPTGSFPLSLTTPSSKLTTIYRMLVSFNMTTLKQHQSLSELDENLIKSSMFFCYICRKNFNSVKLYDAHLTEHPAECFTCGKKFQRWKNFSLHLKRHLGWKEFGCTVCDKKFVVRSALVEHMRMHSGLSPLKCKVCGKHFKRYSNLTQHRKRHTKQIIRRKEFVCYCGEVLPSKARFLWHKEIHDSKPKCCPHCCDRFVHVNSLRRHIRLAHSDKFDYTEPMECPICKQIFAKASIKAHMATHSTETQYDCVICNKSFSTKWNLKIHSWVHANRTTKPFKCEYCPKAFVREVDFKNHMNSHKQIKPYTCEVCGCKFIRKYNYLRHRREHHGNKKYTCDLCKKSFHRHYYLIEHRRIHTGERPFQCSICGKSSTTKTNHNKHLKIHHSRDPFTVEV